MAVPLPVRRRRLHRRWSGLRARLIILAGGTMPFLLLGLSAVR